MKLTDPIHTLKGIGEKTTAILNKVGIKTVRDFLYHLPKNYENYQTPTKISDVKPGNIVIRGTISNLATRHTHRRNFTITEGLIHDDSDTIRVIWFNQPYRIHQFIANKVYYFTGTYDFKYGHYQLISPSASLASEINLHNSLVPIYTAHHTLKSKDFHRLISASRDQFADIPELLPNVPPNTRKNALFHAHFPENIKDIMSARTYLAYEELFTLILAAKLNKQVNQQLKTKPLLFHATKIRDFITRLPFQLTNSQRQATWEIFQDLAKPTPMNRLLQGDVGAGKTIVATLAIYSASINRTQSALLTPTAILAHQHYQNLKTYFSHSNLNIALLTGATKQKSTIKADIKAGKIDLVIGTHALLTDDTEFQNLSLVIIDEQHRFGVEQRQKLLLKSPPHLSPHLLTMTATPIPRSLRLTIFGDLDISVINELPHGRQPIQTKIISEIEQKTILYPKIRDVIQQHQQIYWVCPLIEDSRLETISVKTRAEKLQQLFPQLRIAFLHGRMKPAQKDQVMSDFVQHKIDILVSTTVIEVGVDVKNATLIIIENAEQFGLANLHQLRGRVGRGAKKSYCILLTSSDLPPSRRLREIEKSTDGFHLAEVDLKLRGPGEIYGVLQHGAFSLRVASFSDTKLIKKALLDTDLFLKNPENMLKYKELMSSITKYQKLTTLN